MSVRALWLLAVRKEKPVILFLKKYETVEELTKTIEGDAFVPIPEQQELADAVANRLGLTSKDQKGSLHVRSCNIKEEKPVYEVTTKAGPLWPVLVVEKHGILHCALPLVEKGSHTRPSLINIPGISAAFTLLTGMGDFLGPLPRNVDESHPRLGELYLYLGEAAPFGSPIDTDIMGITNILQGKLISNVNPSPKQKQAGWRGSVTKAKNTIHLTVFEELRAMQHEGPSHKDQWEVSGRVSCKADLEGASPEVSLSVIHPGSATKIGPSLPITHPTVQAVSTGSTDVGGKKCKSWRLRFIPPLETFPLCLYTASPPQPPIHAVYEMKGEKNVEIFLQLRRREDLKNSFDYFEVQMPFAHRGAIKNVNCTPNHGNVILSQDKKTLAWDIGQRFPGKSLELTLQAQVEFSHFSLEPAPSDDEQALKDSLTAYAQILFKVSDYIYSGLTVDTKSLQVNPPLKVKVTTASEFQTSEFKVWNTLGAAPVVYDPPEDLLDPS